MDKRGNIPINLAKAEEVYFLHLKYCILFNDSKETYFELSDQVPPSVPRLVIQ